MCPCPICLVTKGEVPQLGTARDMQWHQTNIRLDDDSRSERVETARALMFEDGEAVNSAVVQNSLEGASLTPTRNAFSSAFWEFGVNYHQHFVVDVLHEIELGVWKGLFTHLTQIGYVVGDNFIQELNHRYCQVSTFGRGTICKF